MERVVQAFARLLPELADLSAERIPARLPSYRALPAASLREGITRSLAMLRDDLEHGTHVYEEHVAWLGARRAQEGIAVDDLMRAIDIGFEVMSERFREIFADDLEAQLWWERRRRDWILAASVAAFGAYYGAREAIIAAQHEEILQLSAPVLPLHEGILVVPLVGALNEQRAAGLLPGLLDSIARSDAEVVILDVTALASVDARVVGHLVQAARAAKLLGAEVVLAGMRARLAQEAVRLGLELTGILVVSTLATAMEQALRLQGKAILRR